MLTLNARFEQRRILSCVAVAHKLFIGASQIVYEEMWDEQRNDKTLKCITFPAAPRRDSA